MARMLFTQMDEGMVRLGRGSSIELVSALDLKSLLTLDFPSDSPQSAPARFTWLPADPSSDQDTDDEDPEPTAAQFLSSIEAYLDSTLAEKTKEYGFDFRIGVPMKSDRFEWEGGDEIQDSRESLSTMATWE